MTEHDTIEAINSAWHVGYKQGYEAACNKLIPGLRQHLEEMIADTAWKVGNLIEVSSRTRWKNDFEWSD